MIIWLNGTFGVGKSTTSELLATRMDNARVFDPEHVGYMLAANFTDVAFDDFQELPLWRELVPLALERVQRHTGALVVAPQTVIVERYWHELSVNAAALGLDVLHVLLDCSGEELHARIASDETEKQASQWRTQHVDRYLDARPWMLDAADIVIDTTTLMPDEVVNAIVGRL